MIIHYCPSCWAEIPPEAQQCPACGASLDEDRDDLVLRYAATLRHPEPTRACLACMILAELHDRRAVPPLIALVESRPRDFEVLVMAVESLAALGDLRAAPALLALLQDAGAVIPARLAALRALVRLDQATGQTALAWAATSERPSLHEEAALLQTQRNGEHNG